MLSMNIRLGTFIAASCLLHGGLLWHAQSAETPTLKIGGEARALRITLAARPPESTTALDLAALEKVPEETPAERTRQTAAPVISPARATRPGNTLPSTVRAPVPATAQRSEPRKPASPAVDETQQTTEVDKRAKPRTSSLSVSERISAALQNRLAEAFDYPWLARKRGWQGMVTLSLHVAEDGELSDWKVVRTSGYRLLDRSALQAAQRIGRLPQAEQLLDGQSLNLSIPVRYHLLDG